MDNPSLARIIYVPHLASSPTRWHAPELFNDSTDSVSPCPTRYSDMWAFGCVLVAVLSDQPPYESYDLPGAISCITEGMRPYTQDICSDDVWELANTLWDTPAYSRASATQAYARLSSL
ncbi:hypothetical protein BDV93DRAFT_230657 [Ceratobasidium sp. AG-I]|nr:hypothetical protein BDV93DRAFT_230657 [Ceratobasidium sp. AG-I]